MRILIIGTGYVGLVTGACLSEVGHHITCLDIDQDKIEKLKKGIVPIYEPNLKELITKNTKNNRLFFTTDYKSAAAQSDVCFLCVPTPSKDDGSANLTFLKNAAKSLADHLNNHMLIAIKSTVPPGTSVEIETYLKSCLNKNNKSYTFDIVSNPEFLREGCAVEDCLYPDRVIIGHKSQQAKDLMEKIYTPFKLSKNQLIFMDLVSAEMTKYASNAMLALRISFMNELAGLCETLGANIENIREGVGSDKRIGPQFLRAGVGFGGSCFPKDIRALRAKARSCNYDMPILSAIETINEKQKKILASKINKYFGSKGGVKNKTIAIWGVSFKPETDDIREAPSLQLIKELIDCGANIKLFDPVAMENAKNFLKNNPSIKWCTSEYEASDGADAVALVTEWNQFKQVDFEKILRKMKGKALFDGRNQYARNAMNEKGFHYFPIGLPQNA